MALHREHRRADRG